MSEISTEKKGQAEKSDFTVKVNGDYVHLVTRGKLNLEDLEAPANAAIELGKKEKVDKLLDDIRGVDSTGANIRVQAKGFAILWKLREFKKVVIVFKHKELGRLFFSTIQTMHITSRFNGFDNEADAIAWLEDDNTGESNS